MTEDKKSFQRTKIVSQKKFVKKNMMQKCWLKKMAYRIAGPKYFNPKKGWSKELLVKTIGQKTILSKKICQKFSQNLLIQKILVNKL